MNRRLLLGLSAVVVVIVAAAAIVLVTRDDGDGAAPAAVALADEQRALLDSAEPSPDCPDEPATPPDDDSLVALDVLRVDDQNCLMASTEYLPAGEVGARQAELLAEDGVVAAGVVGEVSLNEDDDRRDDQWTLDRLGAEEGSPDLPWPDGEGAVLAVLDTGIDETHPDLGNAVIERRHYPGEGEHDPKGHGTHVAGIAAARRDNGGIVGVAPRVSVLDVPVLLKEADDPGRPSWAVGLVWAVNHGADVANMSFGGPIPAEPNVEEAHSLEVQAAAVYFAVTNDVVLVASGGNCGQPINRCEERNQQENPSSLPGVIAVGAVQEDFDLAGYSTRNEFIDLVAPGGGDLMNTVVSTYPDGGYEGIGGTSQAAPHVAAAAALIRAAAPEASGDDIAQALLDTADLDPLDEEDRLGLGVGHGFLDIEGALDQVLAGLPSDMTPSERTHAVFVRDDELVAFDGDRLTPVMTLDPGAQVRWVEWSADGSLLAGVVGSRLFAWDGTSLVDEACGWCSEGLGAFLEDVEVDGATGDFIVGMDYTGALTWYDVATLTETAATTPVFPADAVGTKTLLGSVGGQLLVHESGGAQASERVWLLDPASGTAELSADVMGSAQAPMAASADGEQAAVVTGYGACSAEVTVLETAGLTEVAVAPVPEDLIVEAVFFNGEELYATLAETFSDCSALQPAGLWRLDGGQWQQLSEDTAAARPLEGMDDAVEQGWLIAYPGRGGFEPPLADGPSAEEVGAVTDGPWAMPTRTEVPWP
ncbi:S8 family peptidase [Jiangella rhizosphaerae]|uniref:Peptidase S8/S53 domain-containing protein n=1 Tax=Jiangella rhizosphaerae TaxID=2293569 RepID=A0A418KHW1_9ACTN|nr:S8 family serine peptidase [Jiangella rhizosphaerae]RIQ11904.1 hypothetical protein DY240_27870 [Jiangella rhizosphaerae]